MTKRPRQQILIPLLAITISALLLLPTAVKLVAAPYGSMRVNVTAEATRMLGYYGITPDPGLTVYEVPGLTVLGEKVKANVPVFENGHEILLAPATEFGSRGSWSTTLLHEYGHLLQQQAVEARTTSTGAPLLLAWAELDQLLTADMPPFRGGQRPILAGIESSASCYAAGLSVGSRKPYLDGSQCSVDQRAAAELVAEGIWPDAGSVAARAVQMETEEEAARAAAEDLRRSAECVLIQGGRGMSTLSKTC